MSFAFPGDVSLDYYPCRYGRSKLLFRGPRRDLATPFVAVLGGVETYGKFVPRPYPALLEDALGHPVVNFGVPWAGPDAWANDPALTELAARARVTVLQLTGAQNLTNRFYAVHPRRNDRFLRASPLLQQIFREVDFTEFTFTRHLLQSLHRVSPQKFAILVEELQAAWLARMTALLPRLGPRVVLLWLQGRGEEAEPLLVTSSMVEALRPRVAAILPVTFSHAAQASGTAGMMYPPLAEPAAQGLPGPLHHAELAAALTPVVGGLLQ